MALNPATPLDHLRYVLDLVDMVLVMSVNPGFGGQAFIPRCCRRSRRCAPRPTRAAVDLDIEVDGGIKVDNVAEVARAGANVIVSGSGIFEEPDYRRAIAEMRERAERAA